MTTRFVVNWLITNFFCENTKWKIVFSPHYLKILIKSTNHGLSYSLKRDWKSISKITFVSGFVLALLIQNSNNFSQKLLFVFQISIILAWVRSDGWTIFLFYQDNADLNKKCSFCEKFPKFCINKAHTKQLRYKCNFRDCLLITFEAVAEAIFGWFY